MIIYVSFVPLYLFKGCPCCWIGKWLVVLWMPFHFSPFSLCCVICCVTVAVFNFEPSTFPQFEGLLPPSGRGAKWRLCISFKCHCSCNVYKLLSSCLKFAFAFGQHQNFTSFAFVISSSLSPQSPFTLLSSSANASPSTLARLESRWGIPAGSSIVWSMVSSQMARCPSTSLLEAMMTPSPPSSVTLNLGDTSPEQSLLTWNPPSLVSCFNEWRF